ncbi:MAG: 4Fe-4S dicluster-binding protein [Candidatus Adiutricales bacterium]
MTEMSLYHQLAESVGAPGSARIVKIFQALADEDEAKVLVASSPPASVDEISEKTGLPGQYVQEVVDTLFKKGLIFKSSRKDPQFYYRVRHMVQFHDSTAVARDVTPELIAMWQDYMAHEWEAYRDALMKVMPRPGLRVIPVNVSIQPQTQILAFDDVKNLIDEARSIAVTPCACRSVEKKCDSPMEVCIQFDRSADYAVERGTGRKLTRDEAMETLKIAEENGLVHSGSNQRGPGRVICNCCDCCCMFWGQMGYVSPSRFRAVIDADTCTGCEFCLERCRFDALSLDDGQGVVRVSPDDCMGCGLCLTVCPEQSIDLNVVREEDFVPV